MLHVTPFEGLRYNEDQVGNLDHVITPPYDVIKTEDRAHLAGLSPYNLVHVLLPESRNGASPYEAAAQAWRTWQDEGTVVRDPEPGYYILRQHFDDAEGNPRVRTAFFAAVRLPEAGERIVLGHERTFAGPVEDRLRLTDATRANLGPIFSPSSDEQGALASFLAQADSRDPDLTATTLDGTRQEMWRVAPDPAVEAFFRERKLYIADGHHRFQTAIAYRDAQRAAGNNAHGVNHVLMGLVAFEDPGLLIYLPHRLVTPPADFNSENFISDVEEYFRVVKVPQGLTERVRDAEPGCVLGMALAGKGDYLLRLREDKRTALLGEEQPEAWRALDVAVLHGGVLEKLLGLPGDAQHTYERDAAQILQAAHGGQGLGFLLRAAHPDQIRAVAEAGAAMPQKATYFFPKLPSGAVMHALV